MKRSKLLIISLIIVAAGFLMMSALSNPVALAAQGTHLPGSQIPQFVDPLPLLSVAGGTIDTILPGALGGTDDIVLNMLEFKANMMPSTGWAGAATYTGTWVFGYLQGPTVAPTTAVDTNVGPVIVAIRGNPTQIRYINNLTADHIAWRDWIDQSLHSAFHQIYGDEMPMPGNGDPYLGPVPAVAHLHGGEVPAVIDGGPEAWMLSDVGDFTNVVATQGAAYYTRPGVPAVFNEAVYRYPNRQEASPIWFHDHLLGATRINATYAGLAGAYPIIDLGLALPDGLTPVGLDTDGDNSPIPSAANEVVVPLVIQDRMFDTNGQLFFPNVGDNPEHPIWVPEFVGDTIIVNGKVWPFLNVDRQRYRFYLINGSNSRPYAMFLQDPKSKIKGPRMWVIATDGGYLNTPVLIDPNATKASGIPNTLVMMGGERYEIIIDFNDPAWVAQINAAYGGVVPNPLNLLLRNIAATVMGSPNGNTDGRIMQFRVSATVPAGGDNGYNPATSTDPLRPAGKTIVRLPGTPGGPAISASTVQKTRLVTLNEVPDAFGPLEALANNTKWNGKRPDDTPIPGSTLVNGLYLTELPNEGDTEVWEFVNLTPDAHPFHYHGVMVQILNRQKFNANNYNAAYNAAFPGSATIIDPMTGLPYAAGVYIPDFGPPLGYAPSLASGFKYGGNPDIAPYVQGPVGLPLPYEAGWKDTIIMPPGMVTRVVARFAPQSKAINDPNMSFDYNPSALSSNGEPGYYVWHCHITDHEDNEMMRPDQFQPNIPDASRDYVQGVDY